MTNQQKQCLLCYLGHYSGAIDGIWGPKSAKGEALFRQSRGLSPTAPLEPALLDAICNPSTDWWDSILHFCREEFACKCGSFCDGYPAEPVRTLVEAAESLRNHFNAPAIVSSGLRCSVHNKNVGGVSGSRHLSGKAVDLCVKGRTAQELLSYVQALPQIRYCYAIDGTYIHMDVT